MMKCVSNPTSRKTVQIQAKNPSALAQETADFLGLPYISKRMDEAYLTEHFEAATWHSEHHNPDLNYVAKFALSELPRQHGYKVILSGMKPKEGVPYYELTSR